MQGQRFTSFSPSMDLPRLEAALSAPSSAASGSGGAWYDITNAAGAEAEVFIYGAIGDGGVAATDFVREFAAIRAQRISVRVNSEGGNVFDGFAIYNALQKHPAEVTAYVEGLAASAASYIVMGADRVVMAKRSQLMIHKASGLAYGNADDMAKMAEVLAAFDAEIADVYVDKAGGTRDEWLARMSAETWMNAQTAYELGLADAIDGVEPTPHVRNEIPPTEEPSEAPVEPETPPESAKVDWREVFSEITREAEARLFAPAEGDK